MKNYYDDYEPYHSQQLKPNCRVSGFLLSKDKKEIIDKDEIFAFGIAMKRKYVANFIEYGEIKFGTPSNWIEYASNNSVGKGDILEGVFAAYNPEDEDNIRKCILKNPSANIFEMVGQPQKLVYFRDEYCCNLPTYCFYIIRKGDFELVKYGSSELTAHLYIPGIFFRAFNDFKTWREAEEDENDDKLVFIMIYDANLFLNKIFKALNSIKVLPHEIICGAIQYRDLNKPFNQNRNHPLELFIKDSLFSDQKEGRIVINTQNTFIKQFLKENTIKIGELKDIVCVNEFYPANGLNLFCDLDE